VKRLFIAVLITLLLAAALAAAIAYDPGYVLIAFGNYTLETTVWVGIALVLLILLVMYLLVVALHRTVRRGSLLNRWRASWSDRRGRNLTARGLRAYLEGNFERARVVLDRGAARAESPALNYVLAARAALAQQELKLAELYLLRAQRTDDDADFAIALTQAELQLRQRKWSEALALLTRLRNNAAKHPHVLQLLLQAYTGLNDWRNVLDLAPQLRKYKVLNKEAIVDLEIRATANLLDELGAGKQLSALHLCWRDLPRSAERATPVVASYARSLMVLGAGAEAEAILRIQLKRGWDERLVALYGQAESVDPQRQFNQAEQWLRERGGSAALFLCLGRLALRVQQWSAARDYFEQSLKLEENPQTCVELGRLLARLGQHQRSSEFYERSLQLAAPAIA
jgi:HemY protein